MPAGVLAAPPASRRPRGLTSRARLTVALAALALASAGGSAAKTNATKTIVVTTTADGADPAPGDGVCKAKLSVLQKPGSGTCSLRAAVQTANFGPRGSYLIELPAGTFHLSVPGKNEGKAAKGDLDVLQANVTLAGKGPAKTTIDGAGIDRVFDVSAFAGLNAEDLRIIGGKSEAGGALKVNGTATLENVLIENNNVSYAGGAIFVGTTGGVDLEQTTLSHNVARLGAGVFVEGHVGMTNVTISGNNATQFGGGIHAGVHAKAKLLHVTIAGNTANGSYSAISVGGPLTKVTVRSSIVAGTCYLPPGDHFPSPQRNVLTGKDCGDDPPVPDAGLLSLAAQGNVVPTIGLKPTSPAIDFAFPNTCPKVDARGVSRPQGAGCDSGAYELVKP